MPAVGTPMIVGADLLTFPSLQTQDGMSAEIGAVYLPASSAACVLAYFTAVMNDGSAGATWLVTRSFLSSSVGAISALAALVTLATQNTIGGLTAINITAAGSPSRVRFLINGAGVGVVVNWKCSVQVVQVP